MARKIAGSLFLFAMLVSAGTASASVRLGESNINSLSTGLVGHWPFDGNTTSWKTDTTQDVSGNGNTGQLINMSTTTSPVPGKIGGALNFNGSNNINIASSFGQPSNLAVALWFKTTSTAGEVAFLQSNGTAPPSAPTSYLPVVGITTAGLLRGEFYNGSAGLITSTGSVADGKWHYAVMVGAGTTQSLYLDGAFVGSRSGTLLQSWWTSSIIGAGYADTNRSELGTSGSWRYFNGSIDDVRFYNRALSAQEVQQLYTTGLAAVGHSNTVTLQAGLVGYWPFDGNTTSWITDTTQDVSGNGNTGQLTGMSTTTSPVPGKIGGALNFNGAGNFINLNKNQSALMSASTSTISVWMKPTGTSVTTGFGFSLPAVICNSDGDIFISNGDHGIGDKIWVGLYDTGGREVGLSYTLNQWVHVVMVHANGTLSVYENGVLANSIVAGAQDGGNINFPFVIGKNNWKNLSFKGSIDDVRIYNRALSAQEVQQLYALGSANVDHSNTVTLATGLVGYWPFDGNTTSWITDTTQDVSGNGNTGQLTGMSTTTSPVPGKIGGALKFDGSSSYISVTDGSNIFAPTAFTYSLWIKPNQAMRNTDSGLGGKWNPAGGSGSWIIELGYTGDQPRFTTLGTSNANWFLPSYTFSANQWYFVTFTKDASSKRFYVNGTQVSSIADTGSVTTSVYNMYVGYDQGSLGAAHYFPGVMDDVRFYNRALSAQEVAQLYAAGR